MSYQTLTWLNYFKCRDHERQRAQESVLHDISPSKLLYNLIVAAPWAELISWTSSRSRGWFTRHCETRAERLMILIFQKKRTSECIQVTSPVKGNSLHLVTDNTPFSPGTVLVSSSCNVSLYVCVRGEWVNLCVRASHILMSSAHTCSHFAELVKIASHAHF